MPVLVAATAAHKVVASAARDMADIEGLFSA